MIGFDIDLVLLAVAALLGAAAWMALTQPKRVDTAGEMVGALTFFGGMGALWLHKGPAPGAPLILDGVSLPMVPATGLLLLVVFAVMPRRHAEPGPAAALLALSAVRLLISAMPHGGVTAVLWCLACGLTVLALPGSPARRLATPYLLLSAGTGAAGLLLDGSAGSSLLLLAVAIRMGIFPFHGWVVGAYTLAPMAYGVALVAPMSALSMIARDPGSGEALGSLLVMGLPVAALVSVALALVQDRLSRAVALLTVGVEAIVLVPVMDADPIGHLGGLMLWSMTGLSLLGLGLVTAALTSRLGSVSLHGYSGLVGKAPVLAGLFLLFGLASIGSPGTADFASADLVLHGGMAHHPMLLTLFIGAVSLQAYTVLHLFYRVFLGPQVSLPLVDVRGRERLTLVGLAVLLVATGLAPQVLVDGWMRSDPVQTTAVAPTVEMAAHHE